MDKSPLSAPAQPLVQKDARHYDGDYLLPWRMAAIGHQVSLLHKAFPGATVLEVGVGAGLSRLLLERLGHKVTWLDIDANLHPDVVGSVADIPCTDGQFDVFLCCQVLEHLPWDQVDHALDHLRRVAPKGGVISVPTNKPTLAFIKFNSKSWHPYRITFGSRRHKRLRCPKEHYWELESNVTTGDFRRKLKSHGYKIEKQLQPYECLYHQFFVLR